MVDEFRNDDAPIIPATAPADDAGAVALPPGAQEHIDYVKELVSPACQECACVVSELCEDASADLQECIAAATTVCRTLMGEVRTDLDTTSQAVEKVIGKVASDVRATMAKAVNDIQATGINYPDDHDVRTMLLQDHPANWLPVALGIDEPVKPPDHISGDELCPGPVDGVPVPCGWVSPPVAPPPPPVPPPPPPVSPPLIPCEDLGFPPGVPGLGSLPCAVSPPVSPPSPPVGFPPVSPPFPPPFPPPPPTDCGSETCCPDNTTNIYITGGTNIVGSPPVAPPPPPPPPPTSPPAPPDVTCPDPEVIIKNQVTVNVPEPPKDTGKPPIVGMVQPIFGIDSPVNWSLSAPCFYLSDLFTTLDKRYNDQTVGNEVDKNSAPSFFTRISAPFKSVIEGEGKSVMDFLGKVTAGIIGAPALLAEGAWSLAYDIFSVLGDAEIPHKGAAKYFGGRLGQAVWAERVSGFPMTYIFQQELYAYQSANPQYLPTQPTIDSLWVRGRIDSTTWECWTKAQGNIPEWAALHRDSQIGQTNIHELISLKLRGELPGDQFWDRAKSIGWGATSDVTDMLKLAVQLPTQSDLIRFMVRDAADKTVVEKYQLDKGFDTKFTGDIKKWAESQGVPGDIFKYSWYSHWVIPSNTQLYEMGQRFREDRPEVENWDFIAGQVGPVGAEDALGKRPLVVTQNDIRQALEVNDQAPAWIDALMGISYNPMTRTDAVRAYEIGAITNLDLYHRLRDVGYNADDAKTLASFYEQQANRRASNSTGVLTIRKIVKYYKDSAITRSQAELQLGRLIKDDGRVKDLLDGAEFEQQADHNLAMVRLIKKKFIAGEWNDEETAIELGGSGVQAIMQPVLIRRWREEMKARSKHATAAQLCKWAKLRIISLQVYYDRLRAIGYSDPDARALMSECGSHK